MIFTILSYYLAWRTLDQFIILCCDNKTQLKMLHFGEKSHFLYNFYYTK